MQDGLKGEQFSLTQTAYVADPPMFLVGVQFAL